MKNKIKDLINKFNNLERWAKDLILSYPLLVLAGGILVDCKETFHLEYFFNEFIVCTIATFICFGITHVAYNCVSLTSKFIKSIIKVV